MQTINTDASINVTSLITSCEFQIKIIIKKIYNSSQQNKFQKEKKINKIVIQTYVFTFQKY